MRHIPEERIPQSVAVCGRFHVWINHRMTWFCWALHFASTCNISFEISRLQRGMNSVWGRPGCLRCRLFDTAWNWSGFIPPRHKIELDFYFTWSISHSELRRVSCRLVFLSQLAVSPTTHTVKGNERILTYKKHRVVAKCSLLLYLNYTWVMQSQFRLISWFCMRIQSRDIKRAHFFLPLP